MSCMHTPQNLNKFDLDTADCFLLRALVELICSSAGTHAVCEMVINEVRIGFGQILSDRIRNAPESVKLNVPAAGDL